MNNDKLAGSQPSFSTSIWRCLGFLGLFTPTVLKDGWHERKFYYVRSLLRVA
jgi:hypothetical protein